ncbi:MAG: PRC-barrel domain-containing protein [Candidatus Methylomirabilales bacterium]
MRESAVLAVALAFAAALSVQGAPVHAGQGEQEQQKDQKARGKPQAQQSELSKGLKPGTAKVSDVIGKAVQNGQGETLGKIKDVLVDPEDGKAAFVVFDATSGFFQNLFRDRDHYLILPWDQVAFREGKFTANLSKQQLVQVPSFASDAWPRMDTQYQDRVKDYYEQARGPQPQPSPAAPDASQAGQASGQQVGATTREPSSQPASTGAPDAQAPSGQQPASVSPEAASESAKVPPEASPSGTSTGGSESQAAAGSGSGASGASQSPASSGSRARTGSGGTAAGPSSAATPQPAQAAKGQGQGRKYDEDAIRVGDLIRASQFIGKEVRNQENERLGTVDELVLDVRSGQAAYVVLAQGGVLGIGEKLFAIPLQAFQAPESGDRVLLLADKERVAKAPGFDKKDWPTTANPYWSPKSGS